MLTKMSVHEFFLRLGGIEAPGSGSGAALLGLTGVALAQMASKLIARESPNDPKPEKIHGDLSRLHTHLEELIERDAEILKRALPALTAIGGDGNTKDWNAVLLEAAETPFQIAGDCMEAIEMIGRLLRGALPHIACDLKFAALSCHAGLQGAVLLANLNISLLRDDEPLSTNLRDKIAAILDQAERAMDEILV